MRRVILGAWLAAALAFVLPLLLRTPERAAEETPAPAPEQTEAPAETGAPGPVLDESIALCVKTETGTVELPMAEWLPLALAGEMPAAFAPEALKAQAVALRSYALHFRDSRKSAHPEADVCTSPACCCACARESELRERWGEEYERYLTRVREAASATDGQYLVYGETPALAVFHAASYGQTENGASLGVPEPYLVSVSTPETAAEVRQLCTTVLVSPMELKTCVLLLCPEARFPEDPARWLSEVRRNDAGRVDSVCIGGALVSGAALRQILALRSTDFDVSYADGGFTFTVRGYGHGLGMSQYGADALADAGADYREILAHYYPGTELVIAVRN